MANRIMELLREPEEWELTEYFLVSGDFGWHLVSREVAIDLEEWLDRWWKPRWVEFVDLFGSRVRLQVRDIRQVEECTREQRRRARAFERARNKEKKADSPPSWEDNTNA